MTDIAPKNNAKSLSLRRLPGGKVRVTAKFSNNPKESVTAIVEWKELWNVLWHKDNLHDFSAGSKLRRVVRLRRSILIQFSELQMFFSHSPLGNDLVVVSWGDLKSAMERERPK